MNTNYDVVIVGAGPVGISTACLIKGLNSRLNVCVIDKRQEATRDHSLKIGKDAVAKVKEVFDGVQSAEVQKLAQTFKNWENHLVRTNIIESDLANIAKEQGVHIFRSSEYAVTKETLESALDAEDNSAIGKVFKTAQVIIGADGAHSEIRKCVMQDRLINQKVYEYLVELRYKTAGSTPPRKVKEALFKPLGGPVDFEIMGKKREDGKKTVSYQLIVDKETYESLREADQHGKIKGTYANPWSFEEVEEKALADKKVQRVFRSFQRNLQNLQERGGDASEKRISTLELAVYRSESCVKEYKGKYFLLAGDANSGMIYQRGFNKGLKESVACARAVEKFFKESKSSNHPMPPPFAAYEAEAAKIFINESGRSFAKDVLVKICSLIVNVFYALRGFYKKISFWKNSNRKLHWVKS